MGKGEGKKAVDVKGGVMMADMDGQYSRVLRLELPGYHV